MIAQPKNSTRKATKPAAKPDAAMPRGVIDTAKIYRLDVFKKTIGAGDWALRAMRKNGLRVTKIGNLRFVRGSDFAKFLDSVDDGESKL